MLQTHIYFLSCYLGQDYFQGFITVIVNLSSKVLQRESPTNMFLSLKLQMIFAVERFLPLASFSSSRIHQFFDRLVEETFIIRSIKSKTSNPYSCPHCFSWSDSNFVDVLYSLRVFSPRPVQLPSELPVLPQLFQQWLHAFQLTFASVQTCRIISNITAWFLFKPF